jgi:hypothetical protein
MTEPLLFAGPADAPVFLLPALANRHGCVTGATGTGKTVTLQKLAEGFSRLGVPVFLADIKGDLTGLSEPGTATDKVKARLAALGLPEPRWEGCPVTLWDVFGKQGHPVRATISDLGPLLLARLLGLNETQAGVLAIVFKLADDQGLLLLDLKDLRTTVQWAGDHAAELKTSYGNVSSASIGAIQRGLLQLEQQGAAQLFGEPMLDVEDLLQTQGDRGVVNILAADGLLNSPKVYSTFLLWLLAELYERLPEVGDRDKPKLVFFFDEAHLLFSEAPPPLLEKVEQTVRLIRSKGVGVFFVTQSPLDIPERVLGQLGNRVQHALRAFTPRDQRALAAVADTMRPNPPLDVRAAIAELAVGEALVSVLDERGTPGLTQRVLIHPPASQMGPITPERRAQLLSSSLVAGVYERAVDRESAYERLTQRASSPTASPASAAPPGPPALAGATPGAVGAGAPPPQSALSEFLFGSVGPRGGKHPGVVDALAKSAARSVGSTVARELTRGLLGSLLGGGRRR